jgi:hypothetical protein
MNEFWQIWLQYMGGFLLVFCFAALIVMGIEFIAFCLTGKTISERILDWFLS